MLICLNCSSRFDRPRLYRETSPGEDLPFNEFEGCPHCGGEFTERHVCAYCGESIREDHIRLKDGDYVCPDCFETVSVP